MTKPFVLHWFLSDSSGNYYKPGFDPKAERPERLEIMDHFVESSVGVSGSVLRKRLSTSDLSAEFWFSALQYGRAQEMQEYGVFTEAAATKEERIMFALERFAHNDHHDDAYRPELEWHEGQPQPRVEQVQP